MITLDLNHFGFQRAGRPERRKKSRGDSAKPGPPVVGGWTLSMHQAPTRVIIEGGGLQARANLNGGKLDKEPSAEIGEV